jgi:hypothetical protein
MPGARPHPQSSWAEKENAHKSSGKAEIARHSLRNGLRLIARSLRSTGLVSLRRRPIDVDRLDPSVGGTGPHAFAVRTPHAVVRHRLRPSHPRPAQVTTRTPLRVGRDGMHMARVLVFVKRYL